jgi:hypothetical protein
MKETARNSLDALRNWIEKEEFKGWDPFDGLNSSLFRNLPLLRNSALARLMWIQLFKRSPVNIRKITGVPKVHNPKGLGLFLTGYCNLYRIAPNDSNLTHIRHLASLLDSLKSEGWSGTCWGYPFDWQARAFFQPKGIPTIVAGSFIAYGLLDAYDILHEQHLLDSARSVSDFIIHDLNRSEEQPGIFAWSYSPLDHTTVYNASLLGARILARLYRYTGENRLIDMASGAVQFCINHQNDDGSWYYSPLPHHRWIDNFHTGFNLECLAEYMKFSGDNRFESNLVKGFNFWTEHFFTSEGIPAYYHDRIHPVDLHATAELIMACSRAGRFYDEKRLIDTVLSWSIREMQSPQGYF